jgi:glycosyltransferase involved in cell wall biosynthesis
MPGKRILLIIPELGMGGAQRSLAKLSVELAKDHTVWVLAFNNSSAVAYPHGGQYLTLDVFPSKSFISRFLAFFKRIQKLKAIKRKLSVEVAISFLEGADYINVLTKETDKVVVGIRGSKLHDETMTGKFQWLRKKMLIPLLYKKADKLITVNKGIEQELISYFKLPKRNVGTIYNFYDGEAIRLQASMPKDATWHKFYQSKVLVTCGRLAPEKGLSELLYIFNEVKKDNPGAKLLMIGNGPEYAKLLQICGVCGLTTSEQVSDFPDVLFLQNEQNVYRYLNGATLYLMNSSSEGFPNSLAEAMICGVPALSSDCPYGPREIMLPGTELNQTDVTLAPNGILLPRAVDKNITVRKLWVDAINKLLNDEGLLASMSSAARNRMYDFEKDSIMVKWQQIVEE